jgi:hypothetical protein
MKVVKAFYEVSFRICEAGKPHTVEESLLLPAAKDLASLVLVEKGTKQLESILLSRNTLTRRISDKATNVKEQLVEKAKSCKYYYIQLVKSTDVSNMAHLVTFM